MNATSNHMTACAAPVPTTPQPVSMRPAWRAAGMVVAVFMLSNAATPLYVAWQSRLGFSSATLVAIFVAYIVGLLIALPVAGQLSDRFGRRRVLLPGLVAALVACLLFVMADSVAVLMVARFLTGAAVGIVVSAGMAAVVDVAPPAQRRQASLAASVAMVGGAGLGPMLAGAIAQWTLRPVALAFGLLSLVLFGAIALLASVPLPAPLPRAADAGPVLRRPGLPPEHRSALWQGISVFAPGLAATSFVLALGPSLLSNLLGLRSPLVSGLMASAMFLAAAAVQFALRSRPVRSLLLWSCGATALSMGTLLTAIGLSSAAMLALSALLAGAGQGLGQLGGLTRLSAEVPPARRAEAIALLNMGAYVGAGLLPLASGATIDRLGLPCGAALFALLLLVVLALAAWRVVRDVSGR